MSDYDNWLLKQAEEHTAPCEPKVVAVHLEPQDGESPYLIAKIAKSAIAIIGKNLTTIPKYRQKWTRLYYGAYNRKN